VQVASRNLSPGEMEKWLAGPLGLLLVIAQAGFFIYLMGGLFRSETDDTIGATFGPKRARRAQSRPRPQRPEARNAGSAGWAKTHHVLETYFNTETGSMSGYVLEGPFAGRRLEDLSRTECMRLHELCRMEDPEAASFLEAYMTYRYAGGGEAQQRRAPRPPPSTGDGPMTYESAYAILGLQVGASDTEVHKAHRALIKKHHPDRGGSHAQAARINQAKDMLCSKVLH
jgi:hypothetical protein